MRILITSFICVILIIGCKPEKNWYRGNTHAHTVLCGHADSTPEYVTNWYHEHGYNFLILSEHNKFIDPDTVKMPENKRTDFILIPGEEVTGKKTIHTTAMNIKHLAPWDFDHEHKSEIIQFHVDGILESGGKAILNHPNYKYAVSTDDILPVKNLYMFELFNGHPSVNNFGDEEHISTEKMWDELLTAGMIVYGVSSDDAHHFSHFDSTRSNPGRGWVMVEALELTADAISDAMVNGNFYSTNGVILKEYYASQNEYSVKVDEGKTLKELSSPEILGRLVPGKEEGFLIEFIGPQGEVLSQTHSHEASFKIDTSLNYVRAKVSFVRLNKDRGMEEFCAWGQPVFTDGREQNEK